MIPKDAEAKSSSNFSKAHSKPIGEYYNIKAGEYEPTNKGIIHYDKNGVPILFLLSHNGRRKK
ncbi:polymorphic toxin type 50 domain-containing protein [Lactococcus lactis]|uniref:polymorphic toxin type 50 domain-containing protein n=1 Tax=Lactococcus lactis TaxID=1358 RepID=UPI003398073B